jgi:UDP-2,3-diacylglucosamine pyrophosphatase LpxH
MIFTDTLILSDLHLGSEVSRASDALRMLKSSGFHRLILLGDIFSDLNFRRLKKEHWQFLGYIRKLSNPKRGIEVVWVEGNHDQGLSEVMSHLVGIQVYQEYAWEYGGVRHLAIHGHQFDCFVLRNRMLSRFLSGLHLALQKLACGRHHVLGFLEHLDTSWLRVAAQVARGALAHARTRNVQRIFCGHTHEALRMERDGIEYYNSGSWTQASATYITIDWQGVRISEYADNDAAVGESVAAEGRELDFDDLSLSQSGS